VLEEDGNLLGTLDGGEALGGVLVLPEDALVLLGGEELDEGLEHLWDGDPGGAGQRKCHTGAARARGHATLKYKKDVKNKKKYNSFRRFSFQYSESCEYLEQKKYPNLYYCLINN
jgi:hypothetical protein